MLEIEVKFRLDDLAAFRERLIQSGAALDKERSQEENTLYDFPGRELTSKQQALRLRTTGHRSTLTFKSAPLRSRRFKVRQEFEVEVRRGDRLKKILGALGLRPVFHYSKRRAVFRKDRVKICLDETAIGNFVELEGERSRIVRLARELGLPRAGMIKLDYVQLFTEAGLGSREAPTPPCRSRPRPR